MRALQALCVDVTAEEAVGLDEVNECLCAHIPRKRYGIG